MENHAIGDEHAQEDLNKSDIICSSNKFNTKYNRKLISAIIIILILISSFGLIDNKTKNYIDNSLVDALVAFGSARTINGVISMIQSADVGVGVFNISPGELLDPINDMVEDFSTIMKISSVSLVLQKILIEIVSSNLFKFVFAIAGAIFIASLFFIPNYSTNLFFKIFISVCFIRFILIIVLIGSAFADSAFLEKPTKTEIKKLKEQSSVFQAVNQDAIPPENLRAELKEQIHSQEIKKIEIQKKINDANQNLEVSQKALVTAEKHLEEVSKDRSMFDIFRFSKSDPDYDAAKERVKEAKDNIKNISNQIDQLKKQTQKLDDRIEEYQAALDGNGDKSFIAKMKDIINGIKEAITIDKLKRTAEDFVTTSIRLIALFVLKTIVLPLLFLYLGVKGFERIWAIDFSRRRARE